MAWRPAADTNQPRSIIERMSKIPILCYHNVGHSPPGGQFKLLYTSAYVRTLDGNPALRYGPFVEKPWLRHQIQGAIERLIGPKDKSN